MYRPRLTPSINTSPYPLSSLELQCAQEARAPRFNLFDSNRTFFAKVSQPMSHSAPLVSNNLHRKSNWVIPIVLILVFASQTKGLGPNADEPAVVDLDCFVFLVTGKPTAGTPKEELQQMQAAHLQNFDRLAKIKKLTAAGPCSDPEKKVRGIVVVHASTLEKAQSLFDTDPYITQGFMTPEIHPYKPIVGRFVVPENEQSLDKYTLVILSKKAEGDLQPEQYQGVANGLERFAKKHFEEGNLGFAGLFTKPANVPTKRLAVMVFRSADIEIVKESLKELDPLIHDEFQWQVFQQYMVKDAMPGHIEPQK